ncbi:MAG: PAC2 family protein [Dehalococcoidia bacterium]
MDPKDNAYVEKLVKRWPKLREPVLVTGFLGWNDGGQAATAGVRWLARNLDGERIASIVPDPFHVFSEMESRPVVRRHGDERVVRWPRHDFYAVRGGRGWRNDLLVFVGREPDLRWRTYCDVVLQLAQALGSRTVVTLGAFLAAVPHSRPAPIIGYAWEEKLAATLASMGTLTTTYEGPTGMVSVLADAAHRAGLGAVSLWAAVPHYLPTTANPKAALGLLRAVRDLIDVPVDLTRLEDAAAYFEAQVSDAVRSKGEVAEHVKELEQTAAEDQQKLSEGGAHELPNAADIISAFEDMIRKGPHGEPGG